jgi:vacuolar-type H+-ATPase catalytic subunit A/Vma1
MPRCKNCKEKFEAKHFNQKYCLKEDCVRVWVEAAKVKNWKNTKKKMKAELMTLSDYMKIAQQVFNKYIRERDKHKLCVSCEKPLGSKFDAGHYYSTKHKSVTFDEDNVHGQCVTCNQHKHGNLLNYQIGIQKRIGAEKLLELYVKAHETKKYTIPEVKEIIATYKQKIKDL